MRTHRNTQQKDFFEPDAGLPDGFAYRENILSKEEEGKWLGHFETLPFKPFEFHGYLGNRRVVSFGWRYDYAGRALQESAPIPDFLLDLQARAADFAGLSAQSLQQALVTEYAPGAGIGWHRDKPMFEDVTAISFGSACRLRFRRKRADGWDRAAWTIAPRSIYLLRGPARHSWYHSIPAVSTLRYSVTFRDFIKSPDT
jgi:alkylated DNA repair dioxygenase AlkB